MFIPMKELFKDINTALGKFIQNIFYKFTQMISKKTSSVNNINVQLGRAILLCIQHYLKKREKKDAQVVKVGRLMSWTERYDCH